MTVEEIKSQVTMSQLLSERGISVKRSMCRCPFHGEDRHPSMKVFRDGFKCFTCGEHGDVIDFVMKYDNMDFKSAFGSLGGSYKGYANNSERTLTKRRLERQKAEKKQKQEAEHEVRVALVDALEICRVGCEVYEPMSDEWCELKNNQPVLDYYLSMLNDGKEINKIDVFRKCRRLISKYLP